TMPIHQVLLLSGGAIVELDATEAEKVKVLSNNLPIATAAGLRSRVKEMLPESPGGRWTEKRHRKTFCLGAPQALSAHGRFVTSTPLIRPFRVRLPKRARGGTGRRAALRWQ